MLKEHRTFDCGQLSLSGLHSRTHAGRVRATHKERTHAMRVCANAVFLEARVAMVIFSSQPRTAVGTEHFPGLSMDFIF